MRVDEHTELRLRSLENEENVRRLIDDNFTYLSRWIPWVQPGYTTDTLHQDIVDTLEENKAGTLYIFDIFVDGIYAGSVDAHDVKQGDRAEIGYWLGESFTGKGLATKCTQRLIDYMRDRAGITYFYMEIDNENAASMRVAEKLGFRRREAVNEKESRYVRNF